jgi:ATP-dependent Zn protease
MHSVSPETLDKLDVEVRMLVEEGLRIARTRLQQRRAQLELLADELEAVETVDGEALARLLATPAPARRARRSTSA